MNLGIVIGVEKYASDSLENLVACKNDASVVKSVLANVKDFEEILYINNDEAGSEVKRKVVDFVERNKDKNIKGLVFYFSGHGERFNDDFFYLPSDFDSRKRETAGLRNSELDEWIKTLSPQLCVKIVDACFSGTQYIKSESSTEIDLKKSAKKYGLNDIYFWFSSREDEASYAGAEFSRFTESIFSALLEKQGEVRYREIMDAVADDFSNAGSSKPIFVTQSSNIERFGHITESTHKLIYEAFGIEHGEENIEDGNEKNSIQDSTSEESLSIFDMAVRESNKLCFSEEALSKFIRYFNSALSDWDEEIKKAYSISIDDTLECYQVPNGQKLGEWLERNRDNSYFANPTFDTREYQVEEYKALPEKPVRSAISSLRGMALWHEDDREYKLEKVTRTQSFVDGFEYSHGLEKRILKVSFEPKLEIVDPACLYVVPIYSNKDLVVNFSYEFLKRRNWNSYSAPKCEKWKNIKVHLNPVDSHVSASNHIKNELERWLVDAIKKIVE